MAWILGYHLIKFWRLWAYSTLLVLLLTEKNYFMQQKMCCNMFIQYIIKKWGISSIQNFWCFCNFIWYLRYLISTMYITYQTMHSWSRLLHKGKNVIILIKNATKKLQKVRCVKWKGACSGRSKASLVKFELCMQNQFF